METKEDLIFELYQQPKQDLPKFVESHQNELFTIYFDTKDEKLRNKLFEANIGLVYYVCDKLSALGSFDDLFSFACEGLLMAIDNYLPEQKTRFAGYAYICIKRKLLRFDLMKQKNMLNYTISFEDKILKNKTDEKFLIKSKLKANSEYDPDYSILEAEKENIIIEAIDKVLTDREKYIINHLYGLDNCKKISQTDLSKILNTTRSNVSALHKKIILKLKRYFSAKKFDQYFGETIVLNEEESSKSEMMKLKSIDHNAYENLKKKIINDYNSGLKNYKALSIRYKVSESTIKNWIDKSKKQESLQYDI